MSRHGKPQNLSGNDCPLHKKPVSKVCHNCEWYTYLRGQSPTGGDVDEWSCALAFLPLLIVESAQMSRQTAAAVESFRNQMHSDNQAMLDAANNGERTLLEPTNPVPIGANRGR